MLVIWKEFPINMLSSSISPLSSGRNIQHDSSYHQSVTFISAVQPLHTTPLMLLGLVSTLQCLCPFCSLHQDQSSHKSHPSFKVHLRFDISMSSYLIPVPCSPKPNLNFPISHGPLLSLLI